MGKVLNITGTLAIAASLVACSGGTSETRVPERNANAAASDAQADAAQSQAAKLDSMVTAVAPGKQAAPVEMKFDVARRPQVGQPLAITVAAIVRAPNVEDLQVLFQSTDGIEVTAGAESRPLQQPKEGDALSHTVTVTPTREGVLYVSAVALVTIGDTGSLARAFAIPVIVGDPLAAEALRKSEAEAATEAAPGGERVVSMPAQETTGPAPQ